MASLQPFLACALASLALASTTVPALATDSLLPQQDAEIIKERLLENGASTAQAEQITTNLGQGILPESMSPDAAPVSTERWRDRIAPLPHQTLPTTQDSRPHTQYRKAWASLTRHTVQ